MLAARQFVVIGTAGHIDHGKTSLVTALTGKNTDRLKEERERGISIDIDFAPLHLPNGTLVGMVDVPGHERFVRNMVAGAAGIDAALLVVDVNEGVKPQTREHVAILQLLGVQYGVVALTKCDVADTDWLELAREVIREELEGTPFAESPMVFTSTRTMQGMDELRSELQKLAEMVTSRDVSGAFRLPVDKVFSIPGFGTVVSGTAWRGQVQVGDALERMPGRQPVRVRGVQVHGATASHAVAGQRTALNLTGVDRTEVSRGDVIVQPGTLSSTRLLDVRIDVLPHASQALTHRTRVHVHLGTAETLGRVLLLETDEILAGQSGFAQLRLDKELACAPQDRFVLRGFSPLTTVGGGTVIDAVPTRLHRRKRELVIEQLRSRDASHPVARMVAHAKLGSPITNKWVVAEFGVTLDEAMLLMQNALATDDFIALPSGLYHTTVIQNVLSMIQEALNKAHQQNRFSDRVARSAVSNVIPKTFSARDTDWLFEEGVRRGIWKTVQAQVSAVDWAVQLSSEEQAMWTQMLDAILRGGFSAPSEEALVSSFPKRDRVAKSLLHRARETGDVIEIEPGMLVHRVVYEDALKEIVKVFNANGPFTAAMVRDALQVSRKPAIALLEYLDKIGHTKRDGDVRKFVE